MVEVRRGELSYKLVGGVHRVRFGLGLGHPEGVYARALRHELARTGIPFESEKSAEVF